VFCGLQDNHSPSIESSSAKPQCVVLMSWEIGQVADSKKTGFPAGREEEKGGICFQETQENSSM
jgi:hypothetical protein